RLCESGYRRPVPPASRAAGHAALRHHRERVRPPIPRAGVPRGWPGRARRAGGNGVSRVLVLGWALASATSAAQEHPHRSVSLAPSGTEALFEAGLGPRVAGVTSYCRFPREVLALPKVGGYLTPSYEALVALHPDLVVTLPEQADLEPRLRALGFPLMRVDHRSLEGIVRSIEQLGDRCGAAPAAHRAADALRPRPDPLTPPPPRPPPPPPIPLPPPH